MLKLSLIKIQTLPTPHQNQKARKNVFVWKMIEFIKSVKNCWFSFKARQSTDVLKWRRWGGMLSQHLNRLWHLTLKHVHVGYFRRGSAVKNSEAVSRLKCQNNPRHQVTHWPTVCAAACKCRYTICHCKQQQLVFARQTLARRGRKHTK